MNTKGLRLDIISCDHLGRIKTRTRTEGTTTWNYDSGTKALDKLSSVSSPGYSESQTYDATRGLATSNSRTINGTNYTTTAQYDNTARPSYLTYPTGFKIENRYDGFGHQAMPTCRLPTLQSAILYLRKETSP